MTCKTYGKEELNLRDANTTDITVDQGLESFCASFLS